MGSFCLLALWLSILAGCSDETLSPLAEGDTTGRESVSFTTCVPGAVTRATTEEEAFNTRMSSYRAVDEAYTFNIEMYEQGNAVALGSGVYHPDTTITGEGEDVVVNYPTDGTLKATTPLYWPDNVKKYGFKATAGTATMEGVLPDVEGAEIKVIDQTSKEKLLSHDRLLGYAFEPLWNTDGNQPTDNEDGLNYRTLKEWYAANREVGMVPEGQEASNYYKKIPLYLKHQRSLITIKLKAGEGVDRSNLTYANALEHIETIVYTYANDTHQEIKPLAQQSTVDYVAGDDGPVASGVETTEYTCVVEPHNYLDGATTEPIARINLSGQHFTFYASNDFKYTDYYENHDVDATTHMEGYNLQPGQHLVITATLGRGSRKILITAYVEDWTEAVTTSIVDDYGKSGEPIQINSRKELYEFLKGNKNKPGNVAIIVPNSLDLDKSEGENCPWDYNSDDDPDNDLDLWCTLNMAGATFRTNHQIFKEIHPLGNLVNGTITVGNDAIVPASIAETSVGTLERINVLPRDVDGNNSNGKASRAGLVVSNSGTISQCTSELPVYGTYDSTEGSTKNLVGGIAAYSVYSEENGSTMPVIDGCQVNARVDGESGVQGAGIVGEAVGRITNNTFVYGRTLLQDPTNFKNTIHHKGGTSGQALRAYGNSWPTTASSNGTGIPSTNTNNAEEQYDAVIDSQMELEALISSANNLSNKKYRLSGDFVVDDSWTHGQQHDVMNSSGEGNVFFELEGNNHTITTSAMLFSNVQNNISNLTIRLGGNLLAKSNTGGSPEGQEAIAPLAYSVSNHATISNIQVKGGDYRIQGPTVGGVVVWAYGNATLQDCQCKADIQVWLPGDVSEQARTYTGGIVATAAHATITRCVFHNSDKSLFRNTSADYTEAVASYNDASANIYYGGILGGTARKNSASENPSVLITDCTSWFSTSGNPYKGAIIGYARFADTSQGNALTNGTVTGEHGCQGNWWNTSTNAIGTGMSGMTEDQIIGKRNAVTPTHDEHY